MKCGPKNISITPAFIKTGDVHGNTRASILPVNDTAGYFSVPFRGNTRINRRIKTGSSHRSQNGSVDGVVESNPQATATQDEDEEFQIKSVRSDSLSQASPGVGFVGAVVYNRIAGPELPITPVS